MKCMKTKLRYLNFFQNTVIVMILILSSTGLHSQELYVGPNAEFHLSNGLGFTTSNTVVQVDDNGLFSIDAGSAWGSDQEFIDGQVKAYGAGNTLFPTGNKGVYAPVEMEHSSDAMAKYVNEAPAAGSNGTDVDAVATVEYWELSGNAVVTLPWNENSDITNLVNNNGGALSSVAIVGLNSGAWDLVSASHTFTVTGDLLNGDVTSDLNIPVNLDGYGQFTFGIDRQVVLSVNDLFLNTGISLLSNPVKSYESDIRFVASSEMLDVKASIYDISGRLVRSYDHVDLSQGEGNLPKSNLKSGLYFVKFEHEGKQGVKKLLIE